MKEIVLVRGGGDIATGVIQKLYRSGFNVVIAETERPTAIRRWVCLSEAIYEGEVSVEDMVSVYAQGIKDIYSAWDKNKIPVIKDSKLRILRHISPLALVDATICKKNIGTNRAMAPITVALGPGYVAGKDVDIVVETNRGHNLGRIILQGEATQNTGVPGIIGGYGKERVIYAPNDGILHIVKDIGATVKKDDVICIVGDKEVRATIDGLIRGMIREGMNVKSGLKIADIDPRVSELENCSRISDKARNIGGAVLEAIMYFYSMSTSAKRHSFLEVYDSNGYALNSVNHWS